MGRIADEQELEDIARRATEELAVATRPRESSDDEGGANPHGNR
jgi:hypothetical protein